MRRRSRINGAQQLLFDGQKWQLYKIVNAKNRIIKDVSPRNRRRYDAVGHTGHDFKASLLDRAKAYADGRSIAPPYIQQGSYYQRYAWSYRKRHGRYPRWWMNHKMVYPANWGDEVKV